MADVFLSYTERNHFDKTISEKVKMALEMKGIDVWYAPERIPPGSNYKDFIRPNVKDSKIFILIASKHALDSGEVLIEIEAASTSNLKIIPLLMPSTDEKTYRNIISSNPILDHSLATKPIQYIDMNETNVQASIERLCESVSAHLEGKEKNFKSEYAPVSEAAKIEGLRALLFDGEFDNVKKQLNDWTPYLKDKDFYNLANIICDLSTYEIRQLNSSTHEKYLRQLEMLLSNRDYKNISLYIIFAILICYFGKFSLCSSIGTAKDLAKKVGERPFISFNDKKIIRHLKLCEDFDKQYSFLF